MISEKIPLIEQYTCVDAGYMPLIIRDGWQVAKLNYMPTQDIKAIHKLDKHCKTDEVFIMLNGTSVLIGAEETETGVFEFTCKRLEPGVTYNIRAGVWHNIAMLEDAELIIVEKNNTHLNDFEYYFLSDCQRIELEGLIVSCIHSN